MEIPHCGSHTTTHTFTPTRQAHTHTHTHTLKFGEDINPEGYATHSSEARGSRRPGGTGKTGLTGNAIVTRRPWKTLNRRQRGEQLRQATGRRSSLRVNSSTVSLITEGQIREM